MCNIHALLFYGLMQTDCGKYAEAERAFLRALTIYQRVLVADHPTIAETQKKLAMIKRAGLKNPKQA